MTTIVGIAGSLRNDSYNAALLRAAAELVPEAVTLHIASIKAIPLYDGDLEAAQGLPTAVTELKDRIAAADGLLIATPEYNSSIPGVLKNAMDWLSRPGDDIGRVFGGKPVALTGATPGGRGTVLSQTAWLPVLRALGTRPWFGSALYVAGAHKLFDAKGNLVDDPMRERLRKYVAGFANFIST
ncbi:MAG: NADPH-dependent FMN reductase [Gammaproteobacteria bacterium SG8_47]|nr:MAG: NADPH-dependent FMN reductase [Gammaproteobacteria bacterium SG8_47]